MIEKLVERLDELNFKLEIQIENNSDELVLLNELAENNIRSTEEVHEKHFETIAVSKNTTITIITVKR